MKSKTKKILFYLLFTAQSILLLVLIYDYYHNPDSMLHSIFDQGDETKDPNDQNRFVDSNGGNTDTPYELFPEDIQDLYIKRDVSQIPSKPFQEELKDTYVYQITQHNLVYLQELFQRSDLCEDAWYQEVDELIDILDKQNYYWLHNGDTQVMELARKQDELSKALKAMRNDTTSASIDLVKRCYRAFIVYYEDKFDWGSGT